MDEFLLKNIHIHPHCLAIPVAGLPVIVTSRNECIHDAYLAARMMTQ